MAGGCSRTSAAPPRWRSGARARWSARHHVERSARHGDPAAIALLREAGAAAAGRAPATAARLFGAALRLIGPRAPERADLLAAQAGAHMGAGQWQRGLRRDPRVAWS